MSDAAGSGEPGGDKKGDLFIADTGNSRIQELSPTGQYLAEWRVTLSFTSKVAVDDRGTIYVSSSNRVFRHSP